MKKREYNIIPDEMWLRDFCRVFGYPVRRVMEGCNSDYGHQVGYQKKPGTNSPWIIYVESARKLLRERKI